jgi:putative peptidoglycan lipid II flippase
MLRLAVPTVLYVITNLVAVSFRNASAFAVPGLDNAGPSILTYAWIFYQLPYGILAVALATAVFTELSAAAGREDNEAFKATFSSGLRATGVLMLPTSAIMIALSVPLISLYRVGAFTAADVPLVAGALRWWAGGLIFYATTMYLLRAFYSLKDTLTPMWVNLALTGCVQIALYLLLSTGIGAWPGFGINGIPMADVAFYFCVSVVLALLLRRRIGGYDFRGIASAFVRMAIASILGGAAAWGVARLISPVGERFSVALLQVVCGGAVGLLVAFAVGRLLGVAEVEQAVALIRRVFARFGARKA